MKLELWWCTTRAEWLQRWGGRCGVWRLVRGRKCIRWWCVYLQQDCNLSIPLMIIYPCGRLAEELNSRCTPQYIIRLLKKWGDYTAAIPGMVSVFHALNPAHSTSATDFWWAFITHQPWTDRTCSRTDVHLLCLPSHTSHLLQMRVKRAIVSVQCVQFTSGMTKK